MTNNNTTAHIAIVEDSEGGEMAVRFPSIDSLRDWEDRTGVFVIKTFPLSTRTAAVKANS